jgi:hypothetical protein
MIPGLHGRSSRDNLTRINNCELFCKQFFNEEELTVVWQSINVEHACHYCVPAHTGIAAMMKVDFSY